MIVLDSSMEGEVDDRVGRDTVISPRRIDTIEDGDYLGTISSTQISSFQIHIS